MIPRKNSIDFGACGYIQSVLFGWISRAIYLLLYLQCNISAGYIISRFHFHYHTSLRLDIGPKPCIICPV